MPISNSPTDYPDLDGGYSSDRCTSPPELKSSASSGVDSDDPEDTRGGPQHVRKQRNTISKQFGSLSRSMSKRIKKNLSKIGSKNSSSGSVKRREVGGKGTLPAKSSPRAFSALHIIGATIHTEKRMHFQEEMVEKYLVSVRKRFEEDRERKRVRREGVDDAREVSVKGGSLLRDLHASIQCINPGCKMFGTAATSYMCPSCYDKQKQQEKEHQLARETKSPKQEGPQYGAGKSQFYAELDCEEASKAVIPLAKAIDSKKDGTIFLSNSTFYNDTNAVNVSAPSNRPEKSVSLPSSQSTPSINNKTEGKNGDRRLCRKEGCQFFGSDYNNGYCSKCHASK